MNLQFSDPELTYIALCDYYRICLAFSKAHMKLLTDALSAAEDRACHVDEPGEKYRAATELARARFEFDIGCSVFEKWALDFARTKSRALT